VKAPICDIDASLANLNSTKSIVIYGAGDNAPGDQFNEQSVEVRPTDPSSLLVDTKATLMEQARVHNLKRAASQAALIEHQPLEP